MWVEKVKNLVDILEINGRIFYLHLESDSRNFSLKFQFIAARIFIESKNTFENIFLNSKNLKRTKNHLSSLYCSQ